MSLKGLLGLVIIILIGFGLALAGSQHGASVFGLPIFALAVGLIFIIQWIVLFQHLPCKPKNSLISLAR